MSTVDHKVKTRSVKVRGKADGVKVGKDEG